VGLLVYVVVAATAVLVVRRFAAVSRTAALGLGALPLCFTWRAMLTGKIYAPIDIAYLFEPFASQASKVGVAHVTNPMVSDVFAEFLPMNAALRWAVAHGEWPLWSPFAMSGSVLAAAAQAAPCHPLTLLGLLLPMADAINFAACAAYFVAAISAFLLFRAIGAREPAAFFGAAAWTFSTYVVFFMHTAHGNSVAMLPLVLLGARSVAHNPGARSAGLLTFALVLLVLCGHPESMLHVVGIGGLYVLASLQANFLRVAVSGLAAGIAALILTAVFFLPMIDAISQTSEYLHRAAEGTLPAKASWRVVAHLVGTNIVPFRDGINGIEAARHPTALAHAPVGSGYAGALLFAPALLAVWRVRSRDVAFFAGIVLLGLLAGANAPVVSDVLANIPLFSLAVNERLISWTALGLCALAAIGADRQDCLSSTLPWLYAGTAAVLIAMIALTPTTLTPEFVRVQAVREIAPLLLAFALLRAVRAPRLATTGLIVLLLIQRVAEAGPMMPTIDRRALRPPFPGLEIVSKGDEPFRVVGEASLLIPNMATYYGLQDIRGFQALTFARLANTFLLWSVPQPVWSNRVDNLAAPLISMMNARYAFVSETAQPPPPWVLRYRAPAYAIAENPAALPRAFVPPVVHIGERYTVYEMSFCPDFSKEAWIETTGVTADRPNGPGTVTAREDGSRLRLQASMQNAGWVVVSNPAWRGWRVIDDGKPLKVHYANHAFIGFYLAPGEHDVVMEFRPVSFVAGAIVSLLGAAALIIAAFRYTPIASSAITFFMSAHTSFFAAGFRRR
jgi:Bacterial membrane protein YfhO